MANDLLGSVCLTSQVEKLVWKEPSARLQAISANFILGPRIP